MTTFIALLRAVNVGGTGQLPMGELKTLCEAAGFLNIRTYIASGNVEQAVRSALERCLGEYAGNRVDVTVRTAAEMRAVLEYNPFPRAAPNRAVAIFLDSAPPVDALKQVTGRTVEDICLGKREIYVHYKSGIANYREARGTGEWLVGHAILDLL
jgi:uncharacterized protein (DUF1697 family)